jgi:hypothetical protein
MLKPIWGNTNDGWGMKDAAMAYVWIVVGLVLCIIPFALLSLITHWL